MSPSRTHDQILTVVKSVGNFISSLILLFIGTDLDENTLMRYLKRKTNYETDKLLLKNLGFHKFMARELFA
jgi:hypothetical protein